MNKQKGLTLIEVIIYVAILGMVSTTLLTMSINMMSLKSKGVAQQELASSLRYISQKINYEIRNAKAIATTTASSISLTVADGSRSPTVFDLNNGNIRMGAGSGGECPTTSPCVLNSNLINISQFAVTNLSSGDSKTQNIKYTISGNYINNSGRAEFEASGTISDSVEVRSR